MEAPEAEKLVIIRVTKETRKLLRGLKEGNDKRERGVDSYDDVIRRLIR